MMQSNRGVNFNNLHGMLKSDIKSGKTRIMRSGNTLLIYDILQPGVAELHISTMDSPEKLVVAVKDLFEAMKKSGYKKGVSVTDNSQIARVLNAANIPVICSTNARSRRKSRVSINHTGAMMGGKVEQAANWVNKEVIQPVGNFVGETVEAIANDPLPFIATIALTAVGVPPPLASAAVTAARGGSMEDIATAAVATYAGGEVGKAAGAGATSAGASATTAKIAASAAGASTAVVVAGTASGKSLDESLKDGLTAGALAGATTGVIEYGKEALAPPETGQGLKAVPGKGTELFGDQTKVSGTGLTEKVPTGGGQGLTAEYQRLPSSFFEKV
jgi:hypothetical protein